MKLDRTYPPGHVVAGTVYRIEGLLGAGGMGTVYEVTDTSIDKRYVLKTLHAELATRGDLGVRMVREAKVLARLEHRNIVQVVTAGVTADTRRLPYFVMEKLSGVVLRRVLHRVGALRLREAYVIGIDLFGALDHAHTHGVVHRDVKPENLFLCRGEGGQYLAKLLDFGISKDGELQGPGHTRPGGFVGTYKYSAPEQLRGNGVITGKADVYAGGLVLHEMIAGRHPFDEHVTDVAVAAAHLHAKAPPISLLLDVPPALEALVARCLAKNPENRPDAFTVQGELRNLLKQWEGEQPVDLAIRVTDRDVIHHTVSPSGVPTDRDASRASAPRGSATAPLPLTAGPDAETVSLPPEARHRDRAPAGQPPLPPDPGSGRIYLDEDMVHRGLSETPPAVEVAPKPAPSRVRAKGGRDFHMGAFVTTFVVATTLAWAVFLRPWPLAPSSEAAAQSTPAAAAITAAASPAVPPGHAGDAGVATAPTP